MDWIRKEKRFKFHTGSMLTNYLKTIIASISFLYPCEHRTSVEFKLFDFAFSFSFLICEHRTSVEFKLHTGSMLTYSE